jgi:hypothetical protein
MSDNKIESILIKLTKLEKNEIEERAKKYNFSSTSEFIRVLALKGKLEIQ